MDSNLAPTFLSTNGLTSELLLQLPSPVVLEVIKHHFNGIGNGSVPGQPLLPLHVSSNGLNCNVFREWSTPSKVWHLFVKKTVRLSCVAHVRQQHRGEGKVVLVISQFSHTLSVSLNKTTQQRTRSSCKWSTPAPLLHHNSCSPTTGRRTDRQIQKLPLLTLLSQHARPAIQLNGKLPQAYEINQTPIL